MLVNTTASRPPSDLGRLADDLVDRRRVLDVQFERGAADGVGQLGQQVHPPRRHRHLGPEPGGADRDRVADTGRGADHEEAQAGDIVGRPSMFTALPSRVLGHPSLVGQYLVLRPLDDAHANAGSRGAWRTPR